LIIRNNGDDMGDRFKCFYEIKAPERPYFVIDEDEIGDDMDMDGLIELYSMEMWKDFKNEYELYRHNLDEFIQWAQGVINNRTYKEKKQRFQERM
jgi:hypothetical protein